MHYELVFETAIGESFLLIGGDVRPQDFPRLAFLIADLSVFIPGLRIVANGHTLTQMTFERQGVRLQGEPCFWHSESRERDAGG